jgi:hypothetical protein
MKTSRDFKGSPIHDKRKIIKLMNKLTAPQMVKLVEYLTSLYKEQSDTEGEVPSLDHWLGTNTRSNLL